MKKDLQEHLQSLADRHGRLTPEIVVSDARKKDSPLNGYFEWDIKKAAQRDWLETARSLIREVRVVITNETTVLSAPYFVRDPGAAQGKQGYIAARNLVGQADLAREAVLEECVRASAAFRRAKEVAAAVGEASTVDALLQETWNLRERLSQAKVAAAEQR